MFAVCVFSKASSVLDCIFTLRIMKTKSTALKTSGRFAQNSSSKDSGNSKRTKKKGKQIVVGSKKYMGRLILAEMGFILKGAPEGFVNAVTVMGWDKLIKH